MQNPELEPFKSYASKTSLDSRFDESPGPEYCKRTYEEETVLNLEDQSREECNKNTKNTKTQKKKHSVF